MTGSLSYGKEEHCPACNTPLLVFVVDGKVDIIETSDSLLRRVAELKD